MWEVMFQFDESLERVTVSANTASLALFRAARTVAEMRCKGDSLEALALYRDSICSVIKL